MSYMILKRDTLSNHYYLHYKNLKIFITENKAEAQSEAEFVNSRQNLTTTPAKVLDQFKNTRQARVYVDSINGGLSHETAIKLAIGV